MLIKKNFIFRMTSAAVSIYVFVVALFLYYVHFEKMEKSHQILKMQGVVWGTLQTKVMNELEIFLSYLAKDKGVLPIFAHPESLPSFYALDRKLFYWVTDAAHFKTYFKVARQELEMIQKKRNCGLLPDKGSVLTWFCSEPLDSHRILVVFSFLGNDFHFVSRTLGALSFIVDNHNQILGETKIDYELPDFPGDYASFATARAKDHHYLFLAQPLLSIRSTRLATLVSCIDETQFYTYISRRFILFSLVFAFFLLVILAWLIVGVHHDLSWLSKAYEFLSLLSQGKMIDPVEGDLLIHDNESSHFFKLIYQLRENRLEYDMFLQERDRLTVKRARLVRQQLEILAQTLDKKSEEKIINELRQVQQTGEKSLFSDSFFSNFVSFSSLFKKLTSMVVDQQGRLQVLLKQLQVALINEAQLRVLKQELDIARSIQEARLPKDPPSFQSIDLFAKMISFSDVGGDFYDYFELSANKLCFVVADVSGKGIPAALFMVITRTLLRGLVMQNDPLNEIVSKLNDLLCVDNPQAMFVTLFLGIINTETGDISYVNCGHPAPIVVDAQGAVTGLPAEKNIALAVIEDFRYKCQSTHLCSNDVLFIYTDGLSESSDSNHHLYGEERIRKALSGLPQGRSARDCADQVLADIERFSGLLAESDDTTCLIIRYLGGGGASRE